LREIDPHLHAALVLNQMTAEHRERAQLHIAIGRWPANRPPPRHAVNAAEACLSPDPTRATSSSLDSRVCLKTASCLQARGALAG